MKKYFIILLLFLTGCTKYVELNELAIIKSIGISHPDNYILYAEIIEEIDKENNPHMRIYTINDQHFDNLFDILKLQVNKQIYLSHIDLLLLDFNLHDEDYQAIINYFLNQNEFRNDFLCVLSNDIKSILEHTQYDEIEKLITTNKDKRNIIKIDFEEIIKNYLDQKPFILSEISYNNEIQFTGNYQYDNKKWERKDNEKK